MAKVLILSSQAEFSFDVWRHSTAILLKHSAELSGAGSGHSLTDDPKEADIILFAEMGGSGRFAETVRAHPYYKHFGEKCFLFDSADMAFPVLPGLYSSLTKSQYQRGYARTGFYLYLIENAFINARPCTGNERYLASFVGSKRTHPVREALFEFGRDDIFVRDTSTHSHQTTYYGSPAEREQFWAEYADTMADSQFSLCPRGCGPASIRLFESMKMGRACVILSDDWQPNDHVNWSDFSITIAERDAARVPEILERNAHRAAEMGECARRAWELRFSEKARFQYVVDLCIEIQRQTGNGRLTRRWRMLRQLANPKNLRWYLNTKKYLYNVNGKIYW